LQDYHSGVPPTAPHPPWQRWFWPPLLGVLLLDLITKAWVFSLPRATLPGWMEHHYNTGVAWSLFDQYPGFVALLTAVLIPILAWVWWSGYRKLGWPENLAFGLILGGALGNAWDRGGSVFGVYAGVRDFIHVDLGFWPLNPWPTFNIADSGISIGFVLLLARAFQPQPKPVPSAS
jgi:signal peptidase II